jgi:hypothetical protein
VNKGSPLWRIDQRLFTHVPETFQIVSLGDLLEKENSLFASLTPQFLAATPTKVSEGN